LRVLVILVGVWCFALAMRGYKEPSAYWTTSRPPTLGVAVASYLCAFAITAGVWVLRTGFRLRSARWWMAAFWVQFIDHLHHATRAAVAMIDHGLSPTWTSAETAGWIARIPWPPPVVHSIAATLVLSVCVNARHRHANPSPEEAVLHNCECAAKMRSDPKANPDRGGPQNVGPQDIPRKA